MPYGRSHESEADIVGQDLMAKSGFMPEASIQLWKNMASLSKESQPEFMSTHPSNQTRIKQLTAHLPKSKAFYKTSNTPSCKKPKM
jgi:predicted Zn-dependent protease